jgi:hypothetical protein
MTPERLQELEWYEAAFKWLETQAENPWANSPQMVRLWIIERGPTLRDAVNAALETA